MQYITDLLNEFYVRILMFRVRSHQLLTKELDGTERMKVVDVECFNVL